MEGWIKLYRKFSEWEWFNISEMVHLFIYLLLNANNEDAEWRGVKVKRGQLITGLHSINSHTHISIRTIRTCLDRLKKTGEIDIQTTNKYSIITICNYDSYQIRQTVNDKHNDKQLTNKRQTTDNKQEEEERKEEKEEELKCTFEIFRKSYPGTKRGLDQEYENLKKKHRNYKEIIPILQNRLIYQKSARQTKKIAGGFVPEWKNLQTWINQGCWEEEIPINGEDKKPIQSIKILNREEYK